MDAATLSFLQDSIGSTFRPVVPTLPNPYDSLREGFNTGTQIEAAIAAGQHAQQAKASIAASQQQMALAAAKSPYEIALLKAKADAIPLDKKYNQAAQQAQIDSWQADADLKRSKAQSYSASAPLLDAVAPPPPIPAATVPATSDTPSSAPARTDFVPDPTLSNPVAAPTFNPYGPATTPGATPSAQSMFSVPTADASTPDPDTSLATMLPGSTTPDVDLGDLAAVSGAENPATATVYRGGKQVRGPNIALPDDPTAADAPLPVADTDSDAAALPGDNGGPALSDVNFVDSGMRYSNGQPIMVRGDDSQPTAAPSDAGGDSGGDAPASFGGYRVPISEADLVSQHNYFSQRAAAARANPSFMSTPRNQRAVEAQLRGEAQQLAAAEAQFRKSQTASRSAAGRTAAPATFDLPNGYVQIPRTFSPRGIAGQVLTPDEAGEQKTKRELVELDKAQKLVSGATNGGSIGDLLTDGGSKDGRHYFTQTVEKDGVTQDVQRSLPEDVYARLRKIVDPLYYGKPYNPDGDAPRPASALADSVFPATPFVLGDPATRPTPPPVRPTQSRLQDAIDSLPPGSLAEQQGEKVLQDQKEQQDTPARQQQAEDSDRKLKPYQMLQQITPLENEVQRREDELESAQRPSSSPYFAAGATLGPADPVVIAGATQRLKESRAKLLAARDPRNYVLGDDGAYHYVDPYRTNSTMTGQTQTVAGATTTRRVTQ